MAHAADATCSASCAGSPLGSGRWHQPYAPAGRCVGTSGADVGCFPCGGPARAIRAGLPSEDPSPGPQDLRCASEEVPAVAEASRSCGFARWLPLCEPWRAWSGPCAVRLVPLGWDMTSCCSGRPFASSESFGQQRVGAAAKGPQVLRFRPGRLSCPPLWSAAMRCGALQVAVAAVQAGDSPGGLRRPGATSHVCFLMGCLSVLWVHGRPKALVEAMRGCPHLKRKGMGSA